MLVFLDVGGSTMLTIGMKGINESIDEMLDNRIFKTSSVDAVLQDNSIVVNGESKPILQARPIIESYQFDLIKKARPMLNSIVRTVVNECDTVLDKVKSLCSFTSSVQTSYPISHQSNTIYYPSPRDYFWGGTEEMLIAKGSDWCHEIARLYCACSQLCEIPSRIVYTYGESDGHVVAEVYVNDKWLLIDPLLNIVYLKNDIYYGSVDMWEDPCIANDFSGGYYCDPQFFRHIAVADYKLSMSNQYDYRLSYCNEYYYSVLSQCWNQN